MIKSNASHWWSGWTFGRRAPPRGPDFADLGTAFGLDARLDAEAGAPTDARLTPWGGSATAPASDRCTHPR